MERLAYLTGKGSPFKKVALRHLLFSKLEIPLEI